VRFKNALPFPKAHIIRHQQGRKRNGKRYYSTGNWVPDNNIKSPYIQPSVTIFLYAIDLKTTRATSKAKTTKDSKIRLKLSGSKSKPLDGDVRVKKISGPP
jgi:hypothetical protein